MADVSELTGNWYLGVTHSNPDPNSGSNIARGRVEIVARDDDAWVQPAGPDGAQIDMRMRVDTSGEHDFVADWGSASPDGSLPNIPAPRGTIGFVAMTADLLTGVSDTVRPDGGRVVAQWVLTRALAA